LSRILNLDTGGFNDGNAAPVFRQSPPLIVGLLKVETQFECGFKIVGRFVDVEYFAIREFVVKKYRDLF